MVSRLIAYMTYFFFSFLDFVVSLDKNLLFFLSECMVLVKMFFNSVVFVEFLYKFFKFLNKFGMFL